MYVCNANKGVGPNTNENLSVSLKGIKRDLFFSPFLSFIAGPTYLKKYSATGFCFVIARRNNTYS